MAQLLPVIACRPVVTLPDVSIPKSGGMPARGDQIRAALPEVNTLHNGKKRKCEISTRVMPPVISGSKASASDLPTGACLPTSGGTIDTSVDAVVVGALPAVAVKVKQPTRPLGGHACAPRKVVRIYWRENAKDDLSRLADMFGADLRDVSMPTSGGSIPSDWLDYSSCVDLPCAHRCLRGVCRLWWMDKGVS